MKKVLFLSLLILSLALNAYFAVYPYLKNFQLNRIDPDQKISEIESYLDKISPEFVKDVQDLAKKYKIPSWGCGPSSYALAKIINQKFFNNRLKIDASYTGSPYEIVVRFGFALEDSGSGVDHTWLEVYAKDKILFIDPTVGQFGKYNKIAYEVFSTDDPNISQTLKNKYGIIDARLRIAIAKALNRIPESQNPYPGLVIDRSNLGYYTALLEVRNQIDSGQEPAGWKDWVKFLTDKYRMWKISAG